MIALVSFPISSKYQTKWEEAYPEIQFHIGSVEDDIIHQTEILVTYGEDLDADIIAKASKLKWVSVASAGLEKMPLAELSERGILVTNAKGIHQIPMSESILAHILAVKRNLRQIYRQQAEKEWSRKVPQTELAGATIVILGPGAIGSAVGGVLKAFGVQTIGVNTSGDSVENMDETVPMSKLSEVLPKADIVLSLLPSTEKTHHLFTQEHFLAMKDSAIFMNFGRGDVVAENVLLQAIQDKELALAILDVYEEEPLPSNHPFWEMEQVIVSPHVSSHSKNYIPRAMEIFEYNLKKWLAGETDFRNQIQLEKGY
ncbi:D-2-hydroxyacid dehydrogenase [Paenisporosarcina cavernae]|uniref:D-2-hydroxyacid dehydrogenase n=1 Tax=Paenisporosarcina cavernae TaxID=2320858 RepID=UPI001EE5F370|nr:D-2-hydroxyacid dehydrogenase [Paenisporosarcina cavernae]